MIKTILFTSKSCKACPQMKENMKQTGIDYVEMDIETDEGMKEAQKYHVRSLPTTIFLDDTKPLDSLVGVFPVFNIMQTVKAWNLTRLLKQGF